MQIERPEGFCPNCWGYQEYEGKVKDAIIDAQIDINNKQKIQSFIQAFATKYLSGIRLLKKQDGYYCRKCSGTSANP